MTPDQIARRLDRVEETLRAVNQRSVKEKPLDDSRVQAAIADPFTWVTQYAKRFDEHWGEKGLETPCQHFPAYDYICQTFALIELERITWIEKSRDLMVSLDYCCVLHLASDERTFSRCTLPNTEARQGGAATGIREMSIQNTAEMAARCVSIGKTT
jgi:hypothetical protein